MACRTLAAAIIALALYGCDRQAAAPTPAGAPRPAAAPVARALPQKLVALGTEPFWSVRIDGASLTYTTPEDQRGTAIAARRSDSPAAARFEGTLGAQRVALAIETAPCSDGMSDRRYAYAATLVLGEETRRGCAAVPEALDRAN